MNLTRIILTTALFLFTFGNLQADYSSAVNASDRGSVTSLGDGNATGNYFAGNNSYFGEATRDYFNFKLSSSDIQGNVTSAYLLLQLPPSNLVRSGTNQSGTIDQTGTITFYKTASTTPNFSAIGNSTQYSSAQTPIIETLNGNQYAKINLDTTAALQAIETSANGNTEFSLGGKSSVESLVSDYYPGYFQFTSSTNIVTLVINSVGTQTVPEPSSFILGSIGLICLPSVRRMKRKK